jgi:hypothetical protein
MSLRRSEDAYESTMVPEEEEWNHHNSVGLFISSAGFLVYDAMQFRRSMSSKIWLRPGSLVLASLEAIVFSDDSLLVSARMRRWITDPSANCAMP